MTTTAQMTAATGNCSTWYHPHTISST